MHGLEPRATNAKNYNKIKQFFAIEELMYHLSFCSKFSLSYVTCRLDTVVWQRKTLKLMFLSLKSILCLPNTLTVCWGRKKICLENVFKLIPYLDSWLLNSYLKHMFFRWKEIQKGLTINFAPMYLRFFNSTSEYLMSFILGSIFIILTHYDYC